MESDKAGGSAPSDGEEQAAAVAEQVQPISNNPLATTTTNNNNTNNDNDDIDIDDHSDPYTDISSMSDNIDNSGHASSLLLDLDNVNNNDSNNNVVSMQQNNNDDKAEQPHNLDILQLSKSSSRDNDSLPPNNNNHNYYSPNKNNSSPISTTTNNVSSPKISPKQLPPPMNILECVTTDNNAMKEPNSPLGSVSVTSLVNNAAAALMSGLGTTGSTPR